MICGALLAASPLLASAQPLSLGAPLSLDKPEGAIRVAAFNLSLARNAPSALIDQLRSGERRTAAQTAALAEILQRVRPDILFLSELDHDPAGEALSLFEAALAEPRHGAEPLAYPHRFQAPVNAGLPTGLDLDGDGQTAGPGDAQGWGVFPGQFGMAILSRWPIEPPRAFRRLLWSEAVDNIPGAHRPRRPDGAPFHTPEAWAVLRLSSKSHWDAPVRLPGGARLHLLVSHPTPPVFDGPEDRNGLRNAAEIRFWTAYLNDTAMNAHWIEDDAGRSGGLPADAHFVILGDLNADPIDGAGRHAAIRALLNHPRVQDPKPTSPGAAEAAAQGPANARHKTPAAQDTADWKDAGPGAPGNLRADYALPSRSLQVLGAGVFWPAKADPLRRLVGEGQPTVSSDHRLVWVDLAPPKR